MTTSYGSFKVFYASGFVHAPYDLPHGWYWQRRFPEGATDQEPVGPFTTEREALDDAFEEESLHA